MLYLLIIATIFISDFIIKNHIEKNYQEKPSIPVLKDHILLRKYHNYGAALNLGAARKNLVIFSSVILTLAAAVMFVLSFSHRGNGLLRLGLSLLLGGAFSNTYDRLKRGYVVDYLSFRTPFPKLNSVIFNLSDFGILIGALFIVLGDLKTP